MCKYLCIRIHVFCDTHRFASDTNRFMWALTFGSRPFLALIDWKFANNHQNTFETLIATTTTAIWMWALTFRLRPLFWTTLIKNKHSPRPRSECEHSHSDRGRFLRGHFAWEVHQKSNAGVNKRIQNYNKKTSINQKLIKNRIKNRSKSVTVKSTD